MAGPSILVRVLGDLSGLGKAASDAGKTAEGVASRAHSAFSGFLGALNQSGVLGPFGAALEGVNDAIGQVIAHGKDIGPMMMGVGGAMAGVGAGLSLLGSKDKAAHQQLQQSIEATGADYAQFGGKIEEAIKHQERFGTTADKTQDALRALTQATHDPQKALDMLGTASDIAAAKHEDLTTAAGQLGKVYNGNTKLLKEFGISIDKTTGLTKDGKTATQALADVLHGQASAAADTFTGKLDAVKARLEDGVATLGQKYGPALQTVGLAVVALGTIWTTIGPVIAGMELATIGPILLIVAAVAALIAIGYVIYRNWTTIWNGIQMVVQVVWDWIKANWPLLLGILLGPIALAAALIYKYWDYIKAGLLAVWNWIRGAWNTVYSFLVAPVQAAAAVISGIWNGIRAAATGALNGIKSVWNTLVDFFRGLIGGVGHAFSDIGNAITGPIRAAFGAIARLWNDTVGAISFKIPGWVPGIGGKGFSMPKIPGFQFGGVMPYTGLALLHAGETVIPANSPARTGPAVVVQNAHFTSDLDVEAFMRKAAWVVQTQRI
jgi:phage-related protein